MKILGRRTAAGAVERLWGERVMNEPIISPWLIYWAGRLNTIQEFCCVVGCLLTTATIFLGMIELIDNDDHSDATNKRLWSSLKKLVCAALFFGALASFIPTRDEAIAMYVARYITPANIEATGEFADKAVDKLIEKILKASKAVKE